jgi:hypothetical protein
MREHAERYQLPGRETASADANAVGRGPYLERVDQPVLALDRVQGSDQHELGARHPRRRSTQAFGEARGQPLRGGRLHAADGSRTLLVNGSHEQRVVAARDRIAAARRRTAVPSCGLAR